MQVQFLGLEDALEKEMATHSSILDWKISWTEEPDELQSIELQTVGHNQATEHACMHNSAVLRKTFQLEQRQKTRKAIIQRLQKHADGQKA